MQTLSDVALRLDAAREADRIAEAIRRAIFGSMRRRGAVLGLSGGIDSSVCAALCVRALGADRVTGLLMPEADSSPETNDLGELVGNALGIRTVLEDITSILEAAGCYTRRDAAIREVVPQYTPACRSKIVLPNTLESDAYRVFSVVVQFPDGTQASARLTRDAYLGILAATNFKQRVRKMMEYHYADRLQYAVVGTPNRLEYDQGFFVKLGDGAADLKPIAHLYKSQVYQLAEYLGIPATIRERPPTTDTYSLAQTQEEFYFSVPLETLDLCLYGLNHGVAAAAVAATAGLQPVQVERIYNDITAKRRVAEYLHAPPVLMDDAPSDGNVQHAES
jgi:NAD+ synthase